MDTLKNPDEVQGNYRICTSVIRNDFLRTFTGRIAFILDAPKENIGPMYWDDMASPIVKDYEGAVSLFNQYFRGRFSVFYTPNGLVEATAQQSPGYNEVDVMGTNDSQSPPSKVKIDGFIAHCGSNWEALLSGKESQLYHAGPAGSADLLDQCLAGYNHADQIEALHKIGATYPIVLMKKVE